MLLRVRVSRYSGKCCPLTDTHCIGFLDIKCFDRSSDRSSIVYETEANRKSDLIPFTGIFQITKQNWSSVDNVLIEIEIPSHFNKKALLFQPHINSNRNALNREPLSTATELSEHFQRFRSSLRTHSGLKEMSMKMSTNSKEKY